MLFSERNVADLDVMGLLKYLEELEASSKLNSVFDQQVIKMFREEYKVEIQRIIFLTLDSLEANEFLIQFWSLINRLGLFPLIIRPLLEHSNRTVLCNFSTTLTDAEERIELLLKVCKESMQASEEALYYLGNKLLGNVQIRLLDEASSSIFDLLLEYPERRDELMALKTKSGLGNWLKVVENFLLKSIKNRLLHAGVETEDIVQTATIFIEPLRRLDQSGYLLDRALVKIKEYLMSRQEYRSVIISIFRNLLKDPTQRYSLAQQDEPFFDSIDTFYFKSLSENWTLDPIEAKDPVRNSSKFGNTFIVLANFFDSADQFVIAYRDTLAQQILLTFSADKAKLSGYIAEMELIKSKVPTSTWHHCEVMISDFERSLFFSIKKDIEPIFMSHIYWGISLDTQPSDSLCPSNVVGPNTFRSFTESHAGKPVSDYLKKYPLRTLKRWPQLERYTLTIDFLQGPCEFNVSYVEKMIIEAIDELEDDANMQNLMKKLKDILSSALILDALRFWIRKRVVILLTTTIKSEQTVTIKIASDYTADVKEFCDATIELDTLIKVAESDNPSSMTSIDRSSCDRFEKFTSYITSMLTNLGAMKLERIHTTLGMFATDYKESIDGLGTYLDDQTLKGILFCSPEGAYSINKLNS